jgi:hypothetical protein
MVVVGKLEWVVKATGASDARDQIEETTETTEKAAEEFEEADDSVGGFVGSIVNLGEEASLANISVGLLSSGVGALAGKLSKVSDISIGGLFSNIVGGAGAGALGGVLGGELAGGIVGRLKQIIGSAGGIIKGALAATFARAASVIGSFVGVLQTAVSWFLAGSSGALALATAIGAAVGLAGTFVLEYLGVLDTAQDFGRYVGDVLPSIVQDAFLALVSFTLGPLSVIGAGIVGFVRGTLEGGLSEGIERAISRAKDALDVFISAWEDVLKTVKRIVKRILGYVGGLAENVGQGVTNAIKDIPGSEQVAGSLGINLSGSGGQRQTQQLAGGSTSQTTNSQTNINVKVGGDTALGADASQAEKQRDAKRLGKEIEDRFRRSL